MEFFVIKGVYFESIFHGRREVAPNNYNVCVPRRCVRVQCGAVGALGTGCRTVGQIGKGDCWTLDMEGVTRA